MKKFWRKVLKNNGPQSDPGRKEGVRFYPRTPSSGLVRIKSSDKEYSAYLVNISREGLMTRARDLPDPDEEITLSFRLPRRKQVFQMKGVVIWTATMTEPNQQKRMGVRFVDEELNGKTGVRDYINRFYSGAPL
jgi:Tfp pilus assembly protein PilZ